MPNREAPILCGQCVRFSLALSWEGFAGKGSLEGKPIALDWEAPDTFEARESWVDASVTEAARLLQTAR
jgi:hypothetical protein